MTNKTEALKPCPFCGGEVVPVCVYHPTGYAFGCPKCGAKGPTYKAASSSEIPAEAIAAWNTRASAAPVEPEALGSLADQAREWASVVRESDKQWSEPLAKLLEALAIEATTITTLAAERDALKEATQGLLNFIRMDRQGYILIPHAGRIVECRAEIALSRIDGPPNWTIALEDQLEQLVAMSNAEIAEMNERLAAPPSKGQPHDH